MAAVFFQRFFDEKLVFLGGHLPVYGLDRVAHLIVSYVVDLSVRLLCLAEVLGLESEHVGHDFRHCGNGHYEYLFIFVYRLAEMEKSEEIVHIDLRHLICERSAVRSIHRDL